MYCIIAIPEMFSNIMDTLKSKLATRLLKLNVNEIEVKIRIPSTDENGKKPIQPCDCVASSVEGEWLKSAVYLEKPDPVTGVTREFCCVSDESEKFLGTS